MLATSTVCFEALKEECGQQVGFAINNQVGSLHSARWVLELGGLQDQTAFIIRQAPTNPQTRYIVCSAIRQLSFALATASIGVK